MQSLSKIKADPPAIRTVKITVSDNLDWFPMTGQQVYCHVDRSSTLARSCFIEQKWHLVEFIRRICLFSAIFAKHNKDASNQYVNKSQPNH